MSIGKIKKYKKEFDYSYTVGAFPTVELLKNKPEAALEMYAHSKLLDSRVFDELWREKEIIFDDKAFARVGINDNSYVMGVFRKYETTLEAGCAHIVLVNPGDMGNLGTIIRTILGFGYKNLAIIRPASDIFDPKTVRASMGAIFRVNFKYFDSFKEYRSEFPEHRLFPFMTNAENILVPGNYPKADLFTLVFGSETTGLEDDFVNVGTPYKIPQSAEIDSLNIAVAVAIGAYAFAAENGLLI